MLYLFKVTAVWWSILSICNVEGVPLLHARRSNSLEQVDPFDLGAIDGCILPTTLQLGNCSRFISHPVPSALLSQTILNIKHKRLNGIWIKAKSLETSTGIASNAIRCADALLKQQCNMEFPPCITNRTDNSKSVQFSSSPSCTDDFPCTSNEPICPSNVTVPLSTCYPVTELNDYSYQYCNTLSGWSNVHVTKWMHVMLQEIEREIKSFSMSVDTQRCVSLYAELRCGTIGRCSGQGLQRMEMNATREVCEHLMYNCVSSNIRNLLTSYINCSAFPSLADKLATPPTSITMPTDVSTQPPSSSPSPPITAAASDTTEFPFGVFSNTFVNGSLNQQNPSKLTYIICLGIIVILFQYIMS